MARKQAPTNTEEALISTPLIPQPVALLYTGELPGVVMPILRAYVSEGWSIAVGDRDDPDAGIISKETATLIAENQPSYFTLKYEA